MLRTLRKLLPARSPVRLAWHRAKAFLAALRYGFPARRLTVIGITGTDGKTTTVGMTAHLLHAAGKRVGAASTAFFRVNDAIEPNASHLTSIGPFELQRFLRSLVREGCTHAVIEMSSHGLVQRRVAFTYPAIAAVTNTTMEHLDYHGTMEQYRRDKGILFSMLRGRGTKVLNAIDESFPLYREIPSEKTLVYGAAGSDFWVTDAAATVTSCEATLHRQDGRTMTLSLGIPGTHNLENALCALSCVVSAGVSVEAAVAALASFPGIPGRMERIDEGQEFAVYVDFAVSPNAYRKALTTLRSIVGARGRVLVLCSTCGNRMREKRPDIGRICSELADVTVATEDETYGEDPHAVLEELWNGIDQAKTDAHKIFDRRAAIAFLFKAAKPGDAVVLCGMGPFTTMTTLAGRIPWDERAVARELLQELGFTAPRSSHG